MSSYVPFFSGSATVSGALTGLLFVALSVAPERISAGTASLQHRTVAATALTALVNALFVSLSGLLPGSGSTRYASIVLGLLGLTSSLALARRLWQARTAVTLSRRWPYLLGFVIAVYAAQLVTAIAAPDAASADDISVTFVYIMFATGITRSWELLGLSGAGLIGQLAGAFRSQDATDGDG